MIDQLMDAWQSQLKSPMPGQFAVQLQPYSVVGSDDRGRELSQFSFGWKRHRCGSATGHLHFRCGPMRVIALNEARVHRHGAESDAWNVSRLTTLN